MTSPTIAALEAPGRKSNPRNTGGTPENPITVPIVTANGPKKGPNIMPNKGARKSPALKEAPGMPNIGKVGIRRNPTYRAENDATRISLVKTD